MRDTYLTFLYLETLGSYGGNIHYNKGWAEAASQNGIKIHIITSGNGNKNHQVLNGINYWYFFNRCYGKRNRFYRGVNFIIAVLRSIALGFKLKIENLHCHVYHFSILEYFVIKVFKVFGFSIIVTIHDADSLKQIAPTNHLNKFEKFSHHCDRFIVHSEFCKHEITKIYPGDSNKIDIILPLDFDFFHQKIINSLEARQHLNIPDDDIIFLFFGHIKASKGLEVLLQAMAKIKKQEKSKIKLLIAGRPWKIQWKYYQDIIKEMGIADDIISRINYIPDEVVPYYFIASNAVVVPYKKIYNSGVIQRAWAYGCSVIASDLPPIKEIIKDNETGILFKTGDSTDLALKMLTYIEHPELNEKLIKNVTRKINNEYSPERIGRQIKDTYSLAIADKIGN